MSTAFSRAVNQVVWRKARHRRKTRRLEPPKVRPPVTGTIGYEQASNYEPETPAT